MTRNDPYDVLIEVVLRAPGRGAPRSALTVLRRLASDGDVAAVLALCRILAEELGMDAATDGLRTPQSLDELLRAGDAPPLLRVYAFGFAPRAFVANTRRLTKLARQALADDDLTRFQRLVRRKAPVEDEVLRAYILCVFPSSVRTMALSGGAMSSGATLAVVDGIVQARVVPGDAADTSFEFGRDFLLRLPATGALVGVIAHELGHHAVERALGRANPSTATSDRAVGLRELEEALPGLVQAAVRNEGRPIEPGDGRAWRSSTGLSVVCTRPQLPGGLYLHFSLTDAGGPIDGSQAAPFAYHVLGLLGADRTRAAVGESARGVFHFGISWPVSRPMTGANVDPEGGEAWLEALRAAGRVGATGEDLGYTLGLAERPPRFYAADPELTWTDFGVLDQLRSGADLSQAPEDVLAEVLRVGVRCGEPAIVRTLAFRVTADPALHDLGRSCCVIEDDGGLAYLGPRPSDLLAVLAELDGAALDTRDGEGDTLLTDAAARGPELVSALLEAGAAVDRPNSSGETPLAVAATFDDAAVAERLLAADASVAARDPDGLTPLHRAARSSSPDLAALLLDHGAEPDARTGLGETPLMLVDSPDVVSLLCASGADPDATSTTGATPLIRAAGRGSAEVVRQLLALGADPDAATEQGETALHYAVQGPSRDAVGTIEALLDASADVDEETNDGLTPLMCAAATARVDVVDLLLERGASVDARSASGNTALILASNGTSQWSRDVTVSDRMEQCIRRLVAAGADVDARNDNGETPLHWATTGFYSGLMEVLLELGADPNVRSRDGATPLAHARAGGLRGEGHQKMIEDLLAAGADPEEEADDP